MTLVRKSHKSRVSHHPSLSEINEVRLRQNVLNLSDTMNNTYMQTVSEKFKLWSVFKFLNINAIKSVKLAIVGISDYESKFVSPCFASAE